MTIKVLWTVICDKCGREDTYHNMEQIKYVKDAMKYDGWHFKTRYGKKQEIICDRCWEKK